ncbi:MAG: hypothetical protein RIB67_01985 [Miltoncostaeaceae bacterium]
MAAAAATLAAGSASAAEILPGGVVRPAAVPVGDPAVVPDPREGGWEVRGRVAPTATPAGLRLAGNTTVVSPPFLVPEGAQTLDLRVAAPGRAALLRVAAIVEGEFRERELGVREPGVRAGVVSVGTGGLDGRTIRLVVDPAPALGATLVLGPVGPFRAPLPGWSVPWGAPEPVGRGRSARLRVREEPARLLAPETALGPGAVSVLVRVRGRGRVRAAAGARAVTLVAGRRWRDLVVPVARRGPVRLDLRLLPAGAGLEVRDLGAVRRRVIPLGARLRGAGAARRVTGLVRPAQSGVPLAVLGPRGRLLARGTSGRAGRFSVRVGAGASPLRVRVASGRLRWGGVARIR